MAGITRFEEIESWKTARQLTNIVYALGNQTGFNRDFGLRVHKNITFLSPVIASRSLAKQSPCTVSEIASSGSAPSSQ